MLLGFINALDWFALDLQIFRTIRLNLAGTRRYWDVL